jgi:hypothetical protein
MAAHKGIRSNSLAQHQPLSAAALTSNAKPNSLKLSTTSTADTASPSPRSNDLKPKTVSSGHQSFPAGILRDYRNRTEALRAVANRDLLRLLATREEQEAKRFGPKAVRR